MQNLPKVSIIIPNFNGLELLKTVIPSVLRTHYPDFEVIVVDNGSSDDSVSYLSKVYPEVSVIAFEENKGIVAAFNGGCLAAHGSLVSFLNNDMEVDPDWLLPLVLAMESNIGVAGCDSKYLEYYQRDRFDQGGGAGRFIDKYGNSVIRGAGDLDKGQFKIQDEVFYGLSLLKKKLVIKVGGFDKSFFGYHDDPDLCWRLHRFGYKILFVPESVIYHMGSLTASVRNSRDRPKKKLKKILTFHFFKNRLRMLIKNTFGFSMMSSVIICVFDFAGIGIRWSLTGSQDYIPILLKALIWNLRNFRDTLQNRIKFENESSDFNKLFWSYSGVWRTRHAIF